MLIAFELIVVQKILKKLYEVLQNGEQQNTELTCYRIT